MPQIILSLVFLPLLSDLLPHLSTSHNFLQVQGVLYDLCFGCNISYSGLHSAMITLNLQSALLHPKAVSQALAKELSHGHTAGPFQSLPLPNFQCPPLGVVPKKDGTWCIIMDLSSPRGSSINDHISKDDYTLHYTTFDHTLTLVARHGQKAVMAKRH